MATGSGSKTRTRSCRRCGVAWSACDPAPGQAPAWGGGEAYHAHQLLLELLSETGLAGLLSWLGGAWLAARCWRLADARARERARAALLALAVTVFPFNTHLAFYSTFWGGLALLLAGLYAGALHGRTGIICGEHVVCPCEPKHRRWSATLPSVPNGH